MTAHPQVTTPATSRAQRAARYRQPLPSESVPPPLDKQLAVLRDAIPNECVRLDNAVDTGRMHPAAAQTIKHALRHAVASFERLITTAQGPHS